MQPLLQELAAELSDTEISDLSPEEDAKTATVERKVGFKDGVMITAQMEFVSTGLVVGNQRCTRVGGRSFQMCSACH